MCLCGIQLYQDNAREVELYDSARLKGTQIKGWMDVDPSAQSSSIQQQTSFIWRNRLLWAVRAPETSWGPSHKKQKVS